MPRTAAEIAVENLAEPICRAHGVALVQVRMLTQAGRAVLQVLIDRESGGAGPDGSGVTLEDCTAVSRDLSAALDVHEEMVPGRYELEVGSPGLDRPLTRLADFTRFTGREAKVETGAKIDGRRRFRGPILGVEGDAIRLEQDGSPVTIPFAEIEKANLVLVLPTRR